MGLSLIPGELKFFDMFDQVADILRRAAERFFALISEFDRLGERAYEIRQEQGTCADLTQRVVAAVDESNRVHDEDDSHERSSG
jgi:hypothetical protein